MSENTLMVAADLINGYVGESEGRSSESVLREFETFINQLHSLDSLLVVLKDIEFPKETEELPPVLSTGSSVGVGKLNRTTMAAMACSRVGDRMAKMYIDELLEVSTPQEVSMVIDKTLRYFGNKYAAIALHDATRSALSLTFNKDNKRAAEIAIRCVRGFSWLMAGQEDTDPEALDKKED